MIGLKRGLGMERSQIQGDDLDSFLIRDEGIWLIWSGFRNFELKNDGICRLIGCLWTKMNDFLNENGWILWAFSI